MARSSGYDLDAGTHDGRVLEAQKAREAPLGTAVVTEGCGIKRF